MMKKGKRFIRIIILLACLAFLGVAAVLGINGYIKYAVKDRILSIDEAAKLAGIDGILVLGCGVWDGGTPTPMLRDRLEYSIELYEKGAAGKLLMSGDHGRKDYDEVNVMKQYAVDAGVPSYDVFMDHAGFSTYESIYRAKEIFQAERIIIVTQGYHMYRALYVSARLGLEAYGVCSDQRTYVGQEYREIREIVARAKDFFNVIFKPQAKYLGEIIPVSGNGDLTND